MERVSSVYLSLLCVGGLLMVVTAEPTVSAWIVTPEADRKEGGQVHMRCVATNLESDHVVAWMTEDPIMTLRWGNHTVIANERFTFQTIQNGETYQDITITDLQRDDTDDYVCNVHDLTDGGGSTVVATARVVLSVLFFPNEPFPICFPEGSITVNAGTELSLRCLSESGNPAVMMEVNESPISSNNYPWIMSFNNNTVFRTLDVTVDAAKDGVTFNCIISSSIFPGIRSSCTIGPVDVRGVSDLITRRITKPTTPALASSFSMQTTICTKCPPSPLIPWIVAFAVTFVLLIASLIAIIILSLLVVKLKRLIKHVPEKETKGTKVDPYMELQPADDKNREYMELAAKEKATGQSTYYQVAEVKSPEHARPGDSTNTKYEEVTVPKNAERQYQNIES